MERLRDEELIHEALPIGIDERREAYCTRIAGLHHFSAALRQNSDGVGSDGAIDAKLESEPERYRASAGVAAPAIVGR